MVSNRKKVPRVSIGMRIKPNVLELLRQGAVYHEIGYQTYLQWLVEEGLRAEARYYGWATPSTKYRTREKPTKSQDREIRRLMRVVRRNLKDVKPPEKS